MALMLTLVTAVATTGTYILIRRDAFREKQALVDAMGFSLETTLADVPRATLQRVVENFGTIAGIRKVAIVDRNGVTLASTDRIDVDRPMDSPFVTEFLHSSMDGRTTQVTSDAFVVLEPLRGRASAGGSHRDIAAVGEISFHLDAIESIAAGRAKTLLGITMGGYVLLCAALALMLRAWVTKPLFVLARGADALREGLHARQRLKHGPDEVGRLASAFDGMADKIDEMVRGLEGQVASRTADLQAERRALQREKELIDLLFQVTAIANEAKSVESALSDALTRICALAGFPAAIVLRSIPGDTPRLEPTKIRHLDDGAVWPETLPTRSIARGEGVAGRVLETATPMVEPPVAAFPLLVRSDVVGVMQFHMGQVSPDKQRLLMAMGTVGIELGRVVERTEVTRMKDDFVSVVSHELRTPLTAIRGSLGLLQHGILGELPAEALEVVTIANESCIRLVRLINDLLDMQRLTAGRIELHPEELDVHSGLAKVIAENQTLADSVGVVLALEPAQQPVVVSMDRDRFIQIVTNLVSNAIKFSPAKTEVTLRALWVGDKARIEVCDRGPGIDDAFKGRIFEQFAQSDGSSTRKQEGTGLGLSISRRLVELHGGTIGFVDRDGGGTTFYFEVPRTPIVTT